MPQIIDPVKAAHAIASVISDRYAKNSQVHNLDDPSFYETVKKFLRFIPTPMMWHTIKFPLKMKKS